MWARLPGTFRFFIGAALVAGLVFRIEHIERRQFKADESMTALRISGHTMAETRAALADRTHSVADVLRFQTVDRNRGPMATVAALADEDPHSAPLFFLIDRLWAAYGGDSIQSLRLPALLFGLLAIAAMYWFCFELTANRVVAATGAALMALSPFFVNYSGQAREYSLWTALITVSTALLVRALRIQKRSLWFWYAIAMALALYADPLSASVLAAHASYVAIALRQRAVRAAFSAASAAPSLLFCRGQSCC